MEYEISLTTGTFNGQLGLYELVITTMPYKVKPLNAQTTVATYDFYLRITSSQTVHYSPKLTLIVQCGPNSVSRATDFVSDQNKELGGGYEYFRFGTYVSSVAVCS